MQWCECAWTGVQRVLAAYPQGESEGVRLVFWGTVVGSWLLTFVRQNGQRNYSIVDRLWPLFPVGLVVQWASEGSGGFSSKAIVAMVLVTAWGVRLCGNSVRRGDYALGAEDYRWAVVRDRMRAWVPACVMSVVWEVFNLGFVSLAELALLYQISVPVRRLAEYGGDDAWTVPELLLVVLMAALLTGETVADAQQQAFQERKRRGAADAETTAGFVHSGLWRFSRHPNVFCELAFWSTLGVFCAVATGTGVASAAGACLLSGSGFLAALLCASVQLTESISQAKYPLYRAYQLRTSRLVPWCQWSNEQVISRAHHY
ncbi:hypothetical protein GGF46_002035 [Coemansia sp. RSA 552]|nr:hypothetical protein GGF46_002035 [Coemansia sp. RSA 552]